MQDADFFLFGYGSLIWEPECDEAIVHRSMGTIVGYRRVFNKRSPRRGCPRDAATLAFDDVSFASFIHDDWVDSLALGTCEASTASLVGALVGYRTSSPDELLARVDAREGYDAQHDRARLGYLRERVQVISLDGLESVEAWAYFSNPGGAYHPTEPLTLTQQAKILINATPISGSAVSPPHARGIRYLEDLRQVLRQYGLVDEGMEAVANEVLALPGPWCEAVVAGT